MPRAGWRRAVTGAEHNNKVEVWQGECRGLLSRGRATHFWDLLDMSMPDKRVEAVRNVPLFG